MIARHTRASITTCLRILNVTLSGISIVFPPQHITLGDARLHLAQDLIYIYIYIYIYIPTSFDVLCCAAFFGGAFSSRHLLSVEDHSTSPSTGNVAVRHLETHEHMQETHEHAHAPTTRLNHASQLHQAQKKVVPVQDVSVRFHVTVPEGVDRRALITALTASLQKHVAQELAQRGVPSHHVSINGIKHVAARQVAKKQQLHGVFAKWANDYLLEGLGKADAHTRNTQLAEMNDETAGHKASGLERFVHRIPCSAM